MSSQTTPLISLTAGAGAGAAAGASPTYGDVSGLTAGATTGAGAAAAGGATRSMGTTVEAAMTARRPTVAAGRRVHAARYAALPRSDLDRGMNDGITA